MVETYVWNFFSSKFEIKLGRGGLVVKKYVWVIALKFINIVGITGGRQAGPAVQGATDQLPVHRSAAQRQEGVPLFLQDCPQWYSSG